MSKPVLKWTAAHPIKAKDNLISSAAREKNQLGFKPAFESDPKIQMNFLMSNEYLRQWHKERGQYERDVYSREETIKEESKIKRRVVQRMMTYRRPMKNDFIDDFIQKKKGGEEPVLTLDKMKYKPDCHGKKGETLAKSQQTGADVGKEPKEKEAKKDKDTKKKKGAKKQKKDEKKDMAQEKSKKLDEDEECDESAEMFLVCEGQENEANKDCCKCEENK